MASASDTIQAPSPTTHATAQDASDAEKVASGPQEVTKKLLEAATQIFSERGFEAANVAAVARKCGLTTGAIYARWPSKRDLFLAVVQDRIARRLAAVLRNDEMTNAEKLAALADQRLEMVNDQQHNLTLEACVMARRDESIRVGVAESLNTEAAALADLFDASKAEGIVDTGLDTAAMVFALQACGLGTQLALIAAPDGGSQSVSDGWNALIGRFVASLTPEHSSN